MKILHMLDSSTPDQAIEMLGTLVAQSLSDPNTDHQIISLGHRSISQAAHAAGVPLDRIHNIRSMGWADLSAIRAVRQLLPQLRPTHVHAWGLSGIVATTVAAFSGPRIATVSGAPGPLVRRILPTLARSWTFTAANLLTPGIDPALASGADRPQLRKSLGLTAADTVILLGGTTLSARHDHALWAAGILQQVYPNTRALVRANPKLSYNHARAFAQVLPTNDMVLFAPSDMPWHLLVQAADLFLFTPDGSLATNSLLWAMAARIPIIASDVPSVRQLLTDRQSALLVPPGKPRIFAGRLEELLRMPALQGPLTENAYTTVTTRFTLDTMQQSFQSLYQSAADMPVGSSRLSVSWS